MLPASQPSARATALLDTLAELGRQTRANTALADKIRHRVPAEEEHRFSLNALVDFDEPPTSSTNDGRIRAPWLYQRGDLTRCRSTRTRPAR